MLTVLDRAIVYLEEGHQIPLDIVVELLEQGFDIEELEDEYMQ